MAILASVPPACCRRNSEKGPSRKRKEERIKKRTNLMQEIIVKYLSAIGRWVGF